MRAKKLYINKHTQTHTPEPLSHTNEHPRNVHTSINKQQAEWNVKQWEMCLHIYLTHTRNSSRSGAMGVCGVQQHANC